MNDPFGKAKQYIRFAEKSLGELDVAWKQIQNPQFFPMKQEFDPSTGQTVLKIVQGDSLPDDVEFHATNALQNLRNSFDQSLYAACTGLGYPNLEINFPWTTDPHDLEIKLGARATKSGKVVGKVPPELWDTFRALAPYYPGEGHAGGDAIVRHIATLANRKHTVGISAVVRSSGLTFSGIVTQLDPNGCMIIGAPEWDPVRKEIKLASYAGKGPFNFPSQFTVKIFMVFDDYKELSQVPADAALLEFLEFAKEAQIALESAVSTKDVQPI